MERQCDSINALATHAVVVVRVLKDELGGIIIIGFPVPWKVVSDLGLGVPGGISVPFRQDLRYL